VASKGWPPALYPVSGAEGQPLVLPGEAWGLYIPLRRAQGYREEALVLPDVSGICHVPDPHLLSTITEQKLLSLGRC